MSEGQIPTPETQTEPAMPNTPEARTETGELKDAGVQSTVAAVPVGAPEAYTDFTIPEGAKLDKSIIDGASPIFKELGLSQAQAQKLVDFYSKTSAGQAEAIMKQVADMRADWVSKIKADPEIGGNLDKVVQDIGRLKMQLKPETRAAFDEMLNFTGAGDHPAMVKALKEIAALVNEGTHVSGAGPSPAGQTAPGKSTRPSLAAAMYPNLASR